LVRGKETLGLNYYNFFNTDIVGARIVGYLNRRHRYWRTTPIVRIICDNDYMTVYTESGSSYILKWHNKLSRFDIVKNWDGEDGQDGQDGQDGEDGHCKSCEKEPELEPKSEPEPESEPESEPENTTNEKQTCDDISLNNCELENNIKFFTEYEPNYKWSSSEPHANNSWWNNNNNNSNDIWHYDPNKAIEEDINDKWGLGFRH